MACLHTALYVLMGGLVNAGQFDPEDAMCIQNMWLNELRGPVFIGLTHFSNVYINFLFHLENYEPSAYIHARSQ